MRKYQPIWNAIKANKQAAISAPIENHKKIISGVRKEKNKDNSWKEFIRKSNKVYQLDIKITNEVIVFKLNTIKPYKSKRPLTRNGDLI